MTTRTRKLLGTIATAIFLLLYSLLVMAIGGHFVVGAGQVAELLFYIVGGIAWLPMAMLIIRWMSRADV